MTGCSREKTTLLLEADNAECDNVYPRMADFSFYGGVYRDVRLIADGPIHFTETDRSRDGVQVRTSKGERTAAGAAGHRYPGEPRLGLPRRDDKCG